MKRVIYITNSFAQNTGDVALLCATIQALKRKLPSARVVVESTHPQSIAHLEDLKGLELYPRIFNIEEIGEKGKWGILLRGGYDMISFLVCGILRRLGLGNGAFLVVRPSRRKQARIFGEVTILLSAAGGYLNTRHPHYLMRLYMYMLGRLWGQQVILFTQSIGPFETKPSRLLIPAMLNHVQAIAVREPDSLDFLRQFNIKTPITLTSDIVFALKSTDTTHVEPKKLVAVCVKLPKNPERNHQYLEAMVAAANYLKDQEYEVIFVSHTKEDDAWCSQIATAAMTDKKLFSVDVQAFKRLYRQCSFIIASRMHCIILASEFNVPFITIPYEPKFYGLARQLNYPAELSVKEDELEAEALIKTIKNLISQRQHLIELITPKVKELQDRAEQNVDWLADVTASPHGSMSNLKNAPTP